MSSIRDSAIYLYILIHNIFQESNENHRVSIQCIFLNKVEGFNCFHKYIPICRKIEKELPRKLEYWIWAVSHKFLYLKKIGYSLNRIFLTSTQRSLGLISLIGNRFML